jgi:hypothetical protein
VEKTTAGLCRIGKRQFGDGLREKNRSVDEPGIIRNPACCRLCRHRHKRHSFGSQLIQNGESLAYVKEQLGHSSISVTVDVYGHLVPGSNRAAVDRLDEVPVRNPGATSATKPKSKTIAK